MANCMMQGLAIVPDAVRHLAHKRQLMHWLNLGNSNGALAKIY